MPTVLRIPRHDDETSFVLLKVESSKSGSSRPLDLRLIGTENEAVYVLSLKYNKVSSLKAKNSPCSQDEWEKVLQFILLGKADEDSQKELLDGVEAVASIEPEESIDITIRKRTEGITQRLGAFQLSKQEEEVDLFQWCGLAIQSTSETANKVSSLKSKFREQQETIEKLNAQLKELIAAKKKHEAELLGKFRDLLNEKKSKIRDQQRLLATAKVDPKKLADVQASRDSTEAGLAGRSRPGKRKAGIKDEPTDEDEDYGFEKMDVDVEQVPNDSEQGEAQTPDSEDEETASEDNVEDTEIVMPPARSTREADANKGNATMKNTKFKASSSKSRDKEPEEPPKTPPRRELPFTTKNSKKGAPAPKQPVDVADDETASEDDEL